MVSSSNNGSRLLHDGLGDRVLHLTHRQGWHGVTCYYGNRR
ncbi:hypothetical protein ACFQL7_21450 [Halocatena marina]|uniref:Uncharacterized protein n=1 Tax=Halocatena marina TaxID=2934937 RepID=A0ABD5YSI8_9EURY